VSLELDGSDYQSVQALQRIASETGVAIVIVHDLRKSGPPRSQARLICSIRGVHHDASYAINGADAGTPAVQFQLST
jgi:hypothetical protein